MGVTEYLTADDVAAELDVHVQTVLRHFREGSLPGRKVGRGWRTTRAALNAWVTGVPVVPGPMDLERPPTIALEVKEPAGERW